MLLSTGDRLAERYEVTSLLGRGGMGEVWAARCLKSQRTVAVKVLLERASRRRELVLRFEREAQAASRVQSPHVCALLDTGQTAEGELFIVYEYLQGESLADRLHRELFLPFEEVAAVLLDVLQGIADAHAAGVLHRDLKPGNVFLVPQPVGQERAVVLDFGVSKLVGEPRAADEQTLTSYEGTVGSFAYMAPEQVLGAARVDERADVYGAGSVAFRALTGRLPFEGLSARMVASLKLEHPTPSLSEATGYTWPVPLETFFAKALARQPSERFASALEARSALQTVLQYLAQVRQRHGLRLAPLG